MSRPRKTPAQERSRATVDRIVEAATRVLDREGIATTTNRIADEAGVSVGSLYQYFPDKHAIIHAMALRYLRESSSRLASVLDQLDEAQPEWSVVAERLVSASVDLNSRYPKAHSVMREFAPRSDEIVREFRVLVEGASVRLVPHLARAGVPDAVALMRARLFVAAADGQIHQLIGGKSTDPAALARAIVDHSTGNAVR